MRRKNNNIIYFRGRPLEEQLDILEKRVGDLLQILGQSGDKK